MSSTRKYGDPVVAARLRQARLAAGYKTAREAAAAFGWSESTYRSHEGGARAIPVATLVAYGETLRADIAWLRGGDGSVVPQQRKDVGRIASGPSPRPNAHLIEARRRAGFRTGAAAAGRFGWKRSTYYAHENGQNGMTDEVAELYAYAFGVEPSWILGVTGSRLPPVVRARERAPVKTFEKELLERPAADAKLGLDASFCLVPELTQDQIAALGTTDVAPEVHPFSNRRWGFPVDYLEEIVDVEPRRVRVCVLHIPDPKLGLRSGDRLLIDVGDKDWSVFGPFALLDQIGLLRIVRLGASDGSSPVRGLLGRVVAFVGRPTIVEDHASDEAGSRPS